MFTSLCEFHSSCIVYQFSMFKTGASSVDKSASPSLQYSTQLSLKATYSNTKPTLPRYWIVMYQKVKLENLREFLSQSLYLSPKHMKTYFLNIPRDILVYLSHWDPFCTYSMSGSMLGTGVTKMSPDSDLEWLLPSWAKPVSEHLITAPWKTQIEGHCSKFLTYSLQNFKVIKVKKRIQTEKD